MHHARPSPHLRSLALVTLVAVASACDDDPNVPDAEFRVACPTAAVSVGDPIRLTFNQAVTQATAQATGNIVLTDAVTGVEVAGSANFDPANPTVITYRPSSQLAYGSRFRVRVQNVTNQQNIALQQVTVCDITTPSPLITQLYWRRLPSAGGGSLRGVSLVSPTLGYVSSVNQPLFRRENEGPFIARPAPVYFTNLFDVSFVDANRGFLTLDEPGELRSHIAETTDGGNTYRIIFTIGNSSIVQTYFRRIGGGTGEAGLFGVAGGGPGGGPPRIYKYNRATATVPASVDVINLTGGTTIRDIDFSTDTTLGAAVSLGTLANPGRLFITRDGGRTWTVVPNSTAPANVFGYRGVAVAAGGSIVVTGFNGYVARFDPVGTGYGAPVQLLIGPAVPDATNPIPGNPVPGNAGALVYTDVEFAPDNPQIGWVSGQIQLGVLNGETLFRGLLFETRDGGRTFVRQGVQGAGDQGSFEFGADFEAVNRLMALSSGVVWAVGESGLVIEYTGSNPTAQR